MLCCIALGVSWSEYFVYTVYTCSAVVNILESPGVRPGVSLVSRSRNVVLSCVIRLSTSTLHLHTKDTCMHLSLSLCEPGELAWYIHVACW